MALLEDMITYLTSRNLVKGDGVDAFRDFKPESPDDIVSLHEYAGDPVMQFTNVVHRSVQVIVRNKSAAAANALANRICDAFSLSDDVKRIDFTPDRWGQVHIRQVPHKIMQDEQGRTHYGFNLGITTTKD